MMKPPTPTANHSFPHPSRRYHWKNLKQQTHPTGRSNKWVRPAPTAETNESNDCFASRTTSSASKNKSNDNSISTRTNSSVSDGTQLSQNSASSSDAGALSHIHRPILKGPVPRMSWKRPRSDKTALPTKQHYQHTQVPTPSFGNDSKTWIRSSNGTSNQNDETLSHHATKTPREESAESQITSFGNEDNLHVETRKESPVDNTIYPPNNNATSNGSSSVNLADASTDEMTAWKRIGRNKLVHNKYIAPGKPAVSGNTLSGDVPNKEASGFGYPCPVTKVDSHTKSSLDSLARTTESHAVPDGLKRVGNHKLVGVSSRPKAPTVPAFIPKRKKPDVGANFRFAKRIRITAASGAVSVKNDDGMDNNSSSVSPTESQSSDNHEDIDEEALTKFAYCQPISSGRRKPHLGRKARSLIRVPTSDTIRICPYFAKGMECTNEGCLLRHDVPPEAAQPACYYFLQKNGMCLKENCPFRHVKSGSTEPCPRFVQTGYCTLENCPLSHVQHRNKTFNAAGTLSKKYNKRHAPDQALVFLDD